MKALIGLHAVLKQSGILGLITDVNNEQICLTNVATGQKTWCEPGQVVFGSWTLMEPKQQEAKPEKKKGKK